MTEALIELLRYLVLLCLIYAGAGVVAAIIALFAYMAEPDHGEF